MRRLSSKFIGICLLGALVPGVAVAQLESIQVGPPSPMPEFNTDALRSSPESERRDSEPPPLEDDSIPIIDVPLSAEPFAARNFLGVGLSYSNAGVTRGLFKISEDTLLQGKAPESSWGMGLVLDLGWSDVTASSFRMKWSLSRVRVGLTNELRAEHGPDKLEESLNVVGLDFLLRNVLPAEEVDLELWWGGGVGVRHAWSSSTAGSGSTRVSKLRHSTVLTPLLSLGSDVDMAGGHQLLVQADWMLLNAFQFTVGLRTEL